MYTQEISGQISGSRNSYKTLTITLLIALLLWLSPSKTQVFYTKGIHFSFGCTGDVQRLAKIVKDYAAMTVSLGGGVFFIYFILF